MAMVSLQSKMISQTAYVAPLAAKRIIVALATALNSMYLPLASL